MAVVQVAKNYDEVVQFEDAVGRVDSDGNLMVFREKEVKDAYQNVMWEEVHLAYYPKSAYKYFETVE